MVRARKARLRPRPPRSNREEERATVKLIQIKSSWPRASEAPCAPVESSSLSVRSNPCCPDVSPARHSPLSSDQKGSPRPLMAPVEFTCGT